MSKKMRLLSFVKKITAFSPRQLEGETRTAEFLKEYLRSHNISFKTRSFKVAIPKIGKAVLSVDGREVPCEGCSMVGGAIRSNYKIISSLVSSRVLQREANINFNPRCRGISKSNYYFAPAVAVSTQGLARVLKARVVRGHVAVQKIIHRSQDILVGNLKNPEFICFAHYDSIETGAIDNASGVAVLMGAILARPELLDRVLFVFAANEELSYDVPIYWGHGFRVFEKRYETLLSRAKKIVVVDSVGDGKTKKISDLSDIMLAFPLNRIKQLQKKIVFLSGDFDHLMTVYHSALDDGRGMSERYMQDTLRVFLHELR